MDFIYTDLIPYIISKWAMLDDTTILLFAALAIASILFGYFMFHIINHNDAEEASDIEEINEMIQFRPHRGGLSESLSEAVDVYSLDELISVIDFTHQATIDNTELKPYGYDARIGWDTYVVLVNGNAIGFTDGKF